MTSCIFSAAAQELLTDAETNNISLINVYEQIRPAAFPAFVNKLIFAAFFRRELTDPESEEYDLIVVLDQIELLKTKVETKYAKNAHRCRVIVRVAGLPIQKTGVLKISLWQNKSELVTEVRIDVLDLTVAPEILLSQGGGESAISTAPTNPKIENL